MKRNIFAFFIFGTMAALALSSLRGSAAASDLRVETILQGGTNSSTRPTAGQFLMAAGTSSYGPANFVAGTNITITTSTSPLQVTIAAQAGGSVSTSSAITTNNFPFWATVGGGLSGTSTLTFTLSQLLAGTALNASGTITQNGVPVLTNASISATSPITWSGSNVIACATCLTAETGLGNVSVTAANTLANYFSFFTTTASSTLSATSTLWRSGLNLFTGGTFNASGTITQNGVSVLTAAAATTTIAAQGSTFTGPAFTFATSGPLLSIAGSGQTITFTTIATSTILSGYSTSTGANPTASLGLSAINGTANTFMRSDAAPALSQAIVPSWTGSHSFLGGLNFTTATGTSATSTLSVNSLTFANATGSTVVLSGALGAGHFRTDSSLEIARPYSGGSGPLLSIFDTANPGVTTGEGAIAYGAYDASGTIKKTSSISTKWADVTTGSGFGVLRLNATYAGGNSDDVALRIFGNNGIALFGASETTGPGNKALSVAGNVGIGTGTDTPSSTLHIASSSPTIALSSTLSGGKRFDMRSGAVTAATGTFDIYDFTSSTSRLAIDAAGNIGIGGTSTAVGGIGTSLYTSFQSAGASRPVFEFVSNISDGANKEAGILDFVYNTNSATHKRIGSIEVDTTGGTANQRGSYMRFYTKTDATAAMSERMRIDSAGNVGIGTTAPASTLHISGINTSTLSIANTLTGGKRFDFRTGTIASGTFDIYDFSSTTSRLVVDQTGNVAIGSTTAATLFTVATTTTIFNVLNTGLVGIGGTSPQLQLEVDSDASIGTRGIASLVYASSTAGAVITARKTRGASPTAHTALADQDVIGNYTFVGSDGSAFQTGASLRAVASEAWTGSARGTEFRFLTTTAGTTTLTERMRIDSAGNVGIGTTQPSSTLHISGANTSTVSMTNTLTGGKQYDLRLGAVASGTLDIYDFTSSTSRLVISPSGNIGIGTNAPTSPLHFISNTGFFAFNMVNNNTSGASNGAIFTTQSTSSGDTVLELDSNAGANRLFVMRANGNLGIGVSSPSQTLDVNGNINAAYPSAGLTEDALCTTGATGVITRNAGTTTCLVSSRKYKHDITKLTVGLDEVMRLNPLSFIGKGDTRESIGFIAEEVNEVEPRLVFYEPGTNDPRGVKYEELTALLTKAIQELNAKVDAQAETIRELRQEIMETNKRK